jgi:hypothetical protein
MNTYWGGGGISPRIFNLGTIWRWVVSVMFQPLYPRGKARYPLNRRLGVLQSRSGRGGKKKSFRFPGLGIETRSYIVTNITVWVASSYRRNHIDVCTVPNSDNKNVRSISPYLSSVGIATSLRAGRSGFWSSIGNFSLNHRVQNSSGAHPASYPMGTRGSFPGGKAAGTWS